MSKRLNLLPKCTTNKKRFNAKYRGRVGRKANTLKKVNVLNFKCELNTMYNYHKSEKFVEENFNYFVAGLIDKKILTEYLNYIFLYFYAHIIFVAIICLSIFVNPASDKNILMTKIS